jgi:RNA polymerase sigma factor (sigma-70 family)
LLVQYMPLAHYAAHQYSRNYSRLYDYDDLAAMALEAVWVATGSYDAREGTSFKTWAYRVITHRFWVIHKYLNNKGRRKAKLESLEAEDDEGLKWQFLCPNRLADQELEVTERQAHLGRALRTLPPRQRAILEERVLGDRTLEEIGRDHAITRERVRQLEQQALLRLRKALIPAFPELRDAPPPVSARLAEGYTDAQVKKRGAYRARKVASQARSG